MSKASAAKKARRKRRQSARNDRWLPEDVQRDVLGVRRIATEIIPRGWEFDSEYSSEDFLTWYYPPSAIDVDDDDEDTEPVTRIWVTDPTELHVILAGASSADPANYAFPVEEILAKLDAVESYRAGGELPDLG